MKNSLEMVVITGMSGSGKSVALHALEDAGYYCVDNLPPELLPPFVALQEQREASKVAIAMDGRSATSLHFVPEQLKQLRSQGVAVRSLFLDANTETLVRRFSETRRFHPLSRINASELLCEIREQAHVLDTSMIRSSQLQGYVKSLVSAPINQLTLVFESFAFKRGVPLDADYVFDVRMLPNPHYEPGLRHLTGQDDGVANYLRSQVDVNDMFNHIEHFISHWLHALVRDHRSYVTVAIGCTGGQHRSVYLVEALALAFGQQWNTLKRHRELDITTRPESPAGLTN